MDLDAPRDDLVRAVLPDNAHAAPLRLLERAATPAADGTPEVAAQRTLDGYFAIFNVWTEIDSYWEGNFLERLAPGCFAKTMAEQRDAIKVLYDHGYDPQLGNKPLGPLDVLEEDNVGGRYEVPLIDTSYNRDFVIPAVEASLLGSSFRFRVIKDEIDTEPGVSAHNPKGLPERSILEVRLYELGPVTFPAYLAAGVGLRSRDDVELFHRLDDAGQTELARLVARSRSRTPAAAEAARSTSAPTQGAAQQHTEEPAGATPRVTPSERRARAAEIRGVTAP